MALAPLSRIDELTGKLMSMRLEPSHRLQQVQEDLKALQRMVRRIEAVLHDAEKREIHEESVKLWLHELKGVARDAEDVLDEYNYEVLRAKVEAGIQTDEATMYHRPCKQKYCSPEVSESSFTSIPLDASFCGKIADEIRKVRQSFDEISKDCVSLRLEEGIRRPSPVMTDGRQSSHFVDAPEIHGRRDDVERVIAQLLFSEECKKSNFSVLPIVGMGGVGKTTLVQHIYNDQRVCGHFEMMGWVCVSDDFRIVELTRRIIESLIKEVCHLTELSVLHEKLKAVLEGKRFLLVLDDVWNEDRSIWESLQRPLKFGAQGSAVITTTRSEIVAKIMQTVPFHQLKCLSGDDCWEVFKQSAFGDRHPNDHPDLMEVGLKIAAKCGGLPLAAKSLGGFLSYETEVGAWEYVLQSDVWDLGGEGDGIIPALRLSYLHLPSHLKQCFLYVSVFPKDFLFKKSEVIPLWMAQGFLQCRGSKQQAEDFGNKCFEELHQRSFFQCYSRYLGGGLFVMHDLIHELAQQISGGEFFPMDGDEAPLQYPCDVRHVSLINQGAEDLEKVFHAQLSNIRTLIYKDRDGINIIRKLSTQFKLGEPQWSKVCQPKLSQLVSHLKFLRTLDLKYSLIHELPDSIGDLKYLRYLNLDGTDVSSLPESICKLYNLQTLSLDSCRQLSRLPKDVKNFCNLEHLKISGTTNLYFIPSGFGKLTSLRTLGEFPVIPKGRLSTSTEGAGGIEVLKELNHLSGVLVISRLCNVVDAEDAKHADLRKKRDIKELVLRWDSGPSSVTLGRTSSASVQTLVLENLQPPDRLEALEIHNFWGLSFPTWMVGDLSSLSRLVKVVVLSFRLCTSLPPLGQLPCLKHLEIGYVGTVGAVGCEFYGRAAVAFPKLEELKFSGMWKWVSWEMPAEEQLVFPRLRHLSLSYCRSLKSTVPLHLLRALEVLWINDCVELISIDLGSRGLSSSGDLDVGLAPLETLHIDNCPQARFSPEDYDEHLLLPRTLRDITIRRSPLLVDRWVRCQDCMLAHAPDAKIWISVDDGDKILTTVKVITCDDDHLVLRIPAASSGYSAHTIEVLPQDVHRGINESYIYG